MVWGANQSALGAQASDQFDSIDSVTLNSAAKAGSVGSFSALVISLRPKQWTKNFVVFIGIVFAGRLLNVQAFERVLLAFIIFCLASSSIYLLNDLLDLKQ